VLLKVFENRVLRIFGPEMEEVAGGWRRLHIEVLHNLYASPNIMVIKSRRMRWVGHVAFMGRMRNAYIVEKLKRPHGGPRYRGEGTIRMDLREIG
jgi:hypothetical protein